MNPILIIQHMKWNIDMVKVYFEYWFPLMRPFVLYGLPVIELVGLFFIGFMLEEVGGGRVRPWDTDPVRNTVHPFLVETCLRLVGTRSRITSEAMTLQGRVRGAPANLLKEL